MSKPVRAGRPSSKDQAKRMLAILNILQANARVPLSHIADLLQITPDAVRRMLEKLACCGIDDFLLVPIYIEGDEVHITDDLPALQRPLRLSSDEARALVTALQRAGISAGDSLEQKLLSATAAHTIDREQLTTLRDQNEKSGIDDTLKKLSYATEMRYLSQITYQKKSDDTARPRIVEPIQLLLNDDVWYVRAWCHEANDPRLFRIDRIKEVKVSDKQFAQRTFEPDWGIMSTEALPVARIRLDATVQPSSLGWPGVSVIERQPDGSTLIDVPHMGDIWLSTEVTSLLGRAEVLEPASLREAVHNRASALLDQIKDTQ